MKTATSTPPPALRTAGIARQQKDIGVLGIAVARQAFVSFARDRGQRKVPPMTKGAIAGTRVVAQGELRPKACPARRSSNRDRQRAGTSDGIRGELFADATNRAAAFRHRNGWWSN